MLNHTVIILKLIKIQKTTKDNKLKKIELLAPAGSADAGFAALEYGANAIYLGLPKFSARAEAVNFTIDDFNNIVGYAPQYAVQSICDSQYPNQRKGTYRSAKGLIRQLRQAQADALIVQDLGIIRLISEYFPGLTIHASTQMAIHNKQGAEYLANTGIKRVTLARELSFAEIKDISTIENLETESFLHGSPLL